MIGTTLGPAGQVPLGPRWDGTSDKIGDGSVCEPLGTRSVVLHRWRALSCALHFAAAAEPQSRRQMNHAGMNAAFGRFAVSHRRLPIDRPANGAQPGGTQRACAVRADAGRPQPICSVEIAP